MMQWSANYVVFLCRWISLVGAVSSHPSTLINPACRRISPRTGNHGVCRTLWAPCLWILIIIAADAK